MPFDFAPVSFSAEEALIAVLANDDEVIDVRRRVVRPMTSRSNGALMRPTIISTELLAFVLSLGGYVRDLIFLDLCFAGASAKQQPMIYIPGTRQIFFQKTVFRLMH